MGDHGTTLELFYGGSWHTVPVLQRAGMRATRGAGAEGQEAPPSTAGATANNASGDYNPASPAAALYGVAGRNTPMRITTDGSVRSTTEAASWRPGRVKGSAWTALTGGGLLRRLQQGATPLKGPLARAVAADSDVVAYWPLTDGTNSTQAASGLPSGVAMVELGDVTYASVDGPAGAPDRLPELIGSDGGWRGGFTAPVSMADTGEWSVDFWVKASSDDPANGLAGGLTWRVSGSYGQYAYHMRFGDTLGTIRIDNDGDNDTDTLFLSFNVFDGQWHHVRVCAQQNGTTAELQAYEDGVLADTLSTANQTIGVITEINAGDYASLIPSKYQVPDLVTSTSVGHIVIRNGGTDDAGTDHTAGIGYAGELAGVRFLRLGVEESVSTVVVGDELDTPAMGPQRALTFVDLLRECVRTDGGMMLEPRDDLAVAMRPLRSMYNQTPAVTISAAGQLEPGWVPDFSDFAKVNEVRAERPDGSFAVYVKTSGPLNVNPPATDPEGIGRVDSKLEVNPEADERLIDHASWAVARGTLPEPRWPGLVVNLDRATSLVTALNAADLGDVILLTDLDAYGLDDTLLLWIGEEENLPPRQRRVTLNTAPASVLEIGIVGAADGSEDVRGQRVATRLSTLDGGITTTATAVVIDSGGVPWTTDPDHWDTGLNGGGLFVGVGGEKMRVTNIAGAGSAWTLTVVRSINGVVKSHTDGAPLDVWTPIRVGK